MNQHEKHKETVSKEKEEEKRGLGIQLSCYSASLAQSKPWFKTHRKN